jgi:hypothetical protein
MRIKICINPWAGLNDRVAQVDRLLEGEDPALVDYDSAT